MKLRIGLLCLVFLVGFCAHDDPVVRDCPEIILTDFTQSKGLVRYTPTFGVAVVDIDNNGSDDLVISNHSKDPLIFLNKNAFFEDRSELIPDKGPIDRHGVTAVDLDNDGDKDLLIAAGGADGIGEGFNNILYLNLLSETGDLKLRNITEEAGIGFKTWRSRHFLPLPNNDGSLIDLYLVCRVRENCPNIFFKNKSNSNIKLTKNVSLGLNRLFSSIGKDLFFDFDRDGDQDLLIIDRAVPIIYEKINGEYFQNEGLLPELKSVFCSSVGDLNNDGYLDLYIGRTVRHTKSDNISYNDNEIHMVLRKNDGDQSDRITFKTSGDFIKINFIQHTPGHTIRDPSNIFIGRKKQNPKSREVTVFADIAEGEPVRDKVGIYLWKNGGTTTWNVEWVYDQEEQLHKGKIYAQSLSDLNKHGCEEFPITPTRDYIFINQNGQGFIELTGLDLSHSQVTRSVIMVDMNNDGNVEIIGLRGGEPGQYNGEPFILINCGDLYFEFKNIMQNDEDDIYQADQLVYGFFDGDGLPDIFFTNGFGLNPGHMGPYKVFLNETQNPGKYVIIELEGRTSNRDALGAEVELVDSQGDLLGYRQLGGDFSRSQPTFKLHFGVGQYSGEVYARIRWPGFRDWDTRKVALNEINFIKQY
jgi:hypothetical protein